MNPGAQKCLVFNNGAAEQIHSNLGFFKVGRKIELGKSAFKKVLLVQIILTHASSSLMAAINSKEKEDEGSRSSTKP